MANTIQHKRGTATPAGAISRGELAIQEVSQNYTTSSSSKLWIGEGSGVDIRKLGFGITGADNSSQSGIEIGGNLTFDGAGTVTCAVAGSTVTITGSGGGGSGTVTSVTAGTGLTQSGTSTVNPTINAIGGNGITANADDLAVTPAQTTITSLYHSSLAIGYGSSHANIDFSTDNQINFDIDGTAQIVLKDGVLEPVTNDDVDLGSSSKEFNDLYLGGDLIASDAVFSVQCQIFEIGDGTDTDIDMRFNANSASGHLWWMEDEDYFKFSDNVTMDAGLVVKNGSSSSGYVKLYENSSNGSHYITIKPPNLTETYDWKYPTASGSSGNILTTDGSGVLSWTNDISGNAATATLASTVTVDATTADTTCFVMLAESASGSLIPQTDAGLTYNADTNKLSIGGNLEVGDSVAGYIQDTDGTLNIAAASTGYSIYFRGGTTTKFRMGVGSTTGWYFRPTTDDEGYLGDTTAAWKECHAGTFIGNLTGNASGTAATVTGGTQASITSCANLTTVGTIGTGTWEGGVIDNDYLDTDTAHLSTTQTFSGTKTFSAKITADAGIDIDNFNIDGTTIALSSGDMLLDSAGDIDFQADDGLISFGVSTTGNMANLHKTAASTDFGSGQGFAHGAALHLKSGNVNTGRGAALILAEKGTAGHVTGFRAPDTLSDDYLYELPDDTGSAGEVLSIASIANDVYHLEWASAGGGGGVSLSGTTNNTVATVTGSNALIGEANLTFDGTDFANTAGTIAASGAFVSGGSSGVSSQPVLFTDATNTLYSWVNTGGIVTTLAAMSDERLKENITPFNTGLSLINQIEMKSYKFTDEYASDNGIPDDINSFIGIIAQDIEAIDSEYIKEDDDGMKSPSGKFGNEHRAAMHNALKELSAKNDALEARIAVLEAA